MVKSGIMLRLDRRVQGFKSLCPDHFVLMGEDRKISRCGISGRLHRLGKAEYNTVSSNLTTGSKMGIMRRGKDEVSGSTPLVGSKFCRVGSVATAAAS